MCFSSSIKVFQNVRHHRITEGLEEATSKWLQHQRFNTTASMMDFVHCVFVVYNNNDLFLIISDDDCLLHR